MADKRIEKYGLKWDAKLDAAQIERKMLQHGGYFHSKGEKFGLGIFQHFKNYWAALWPDDEQTWWTDLMLKEIIEHRFTGIIGPGSSWKTSTCARLALMDWSLFPECTMVLMSSTTIDDLKNRIFGETSKFWARAKEQYDWFPGFPIDYKCVIAAQSIEEDMIRDLRNGIQGVPNKTSDGKVQGLSRFVGKKNTRVWSVCDELQFCAIKGSNISTSLGVKPIELVQRGDIVLNAVGMGFVTKIHHRIADSLVKVNLKDGRVIVCTPNHNVFTHLGWIKACDVNQSHYCLSQYEAMQTLQGKVPVGWSERFMRSLLGNSGEVSEVSQDDGSELCFQNRCKILLARLRDWLAHESTRNPGEDFYSGEDGQISGLHAGVSSQASRVCGEISENGFGKQLYERSGKQEIVKRETARAGAQATRARRERDGADCGGKNAGDAHSGFGDGLFAPHSHQKEDRNPDALQNRRCHSGIEDCHRGGWKLAQSSEAEGAGCQENALSFGAWVDCAEVLQSPDFGGYGNGRGGVEVFNLTVEGHPSYAISGILVHNCERSFLEAQNNLSSNGPNLLPGYKRDELGEIMRDSKGEPIVRPGYKGVFIGNPNPTRPENCLHLVCEPEGGWNSLPEDAKTKTWDAKRVPGSVVQARVINLDARNSPNDDYPDDKPKWVNLSSKKRIAEFETDSEAYWAQAIGVIKLGLAGKKIITREMCDQFHAFDSVVWDGSEPRKKIGMLDAAYGGVGGDRCVTGFLEFGKCADGVVRILFHPHVLVPVKINPDMIPEDQIAHFCKDKMEAAGVAPEDFFFDGRGSLAMSFARIWSPRVNTVEFGGRATDRPAGPNIFIDDPVTKVRRLKLAHEEFTRFVVELWHSWQYAIQSDQVRGLSLDVVMDAMPREFSKVKGHKTDMETKEKLKKRTGCSPDLADWAAIGIEGARRRGFAITKLAAAAPKKSTKDPWLVTHFEKLQKLQESQELSTLT